VLSVFMKVSTALSTFSSCPAHMEAWLYMTMFAYAAKLFYQSNIRSLAVASGENRMVNMRAPVRSAYIVTDCVLLSTRFHYTLET
jgi:hypothetical protein